MKNIFKAIVILLLSKEAQAVLRKYRPQIIAITGTVGKTSTKDAIYATLSQFESVRRSPKSFNSEFGVPLAILDQTVPAETSNVMAWLKIFVEGLILIFSPNHYPKWLVLEVGTDKPGDIRELAKWLHPDIVIVTKLSEVPVHVEAFATKEDLFEEKGYLVKALKTHGTLILNADDKDVVAYRNTSPEKVMLFGNSSGTDISATDYAVEYEEKKPIGISFNIEGHKVSLKGTLGKQHVEHALAALCVIKLLGYDLNGAIKGLSRETPTAGRMRLVEGIKSSVLIDDTYNSSPIAVEEALKSLKFLKTKRKIAILGDMLELGRYAVDEHKKVGEKAAKVVDVLATVGVRSRYTADSALNAGMEEAEVFQFDDSAEAGRFMREVVKEGDVVLIKGSQGVRMERCTEELMAHPEDKERLLVRQEAEWKER